MPNVGSCAPITLSDLKISVFHVLLKSEMPSSRLFYAFSRLSFSFSFPLGERTLPAENNFGDSCVVVI